VADESTSSRHALSARLKALRAEIGVRQQDVAAAIGVSTASVSSWEKADSAPLPEDRLEPLARFYATPRSVAGGAARLVEDLDPAEEARRTALLAELTRLRNRALAEAAADEPSARESAGTSFWRYPDDGIPIRIITSRLSSRALTSESARDPDARSPQEPVPYSNPWHPNFIRSLWDGDRDATIEIFGQIRADNPHADVRFLTADRVTAEDITGHVVVLGEGTSFPVGSPAPSTLHFLIRRHDLPFRVSMHDAKDVEYGAEYVVTLDASGEPTYYLDGEQPASLETHRPVFLGGPPSDSKGRRLVDGLPQLEYDVAVIARLRNELNLNATLTICSGIFSRGTLGAVRALIDPKLRESNEAWLAANVDLDDFWMLTRIPVFPTANGARTVTPDLARETHQLRWTPKKRSALTH
jgi:transcriptional regulator with XRE-family HTH domain